MNSSIITRSDAARAFGAPARRGRCGAPISAGHRSGALGPSGCTALDALHLALPGQRVVEERGSLERVHEHKPTRDVGPQALVVEDGEREEEVDDAEHEEKLLAEESPLVVHHGGQLGAGGGDHEEPEELKQEGCGRGSAEVRQKFVIAWNWEGGAGREDVAGAHEEHRSVGSEGDDLDVLGRRHDGDTMRRLN